MRKTKLSILILVTISFLFICFSNAYALSPQLPEVIVANDVSAFYGSWELEYVSVLNNIINYRELNMGTV